MLKFILGSDIYSYVKQNRGLVFCALALTMISSLLATVPVYLLQPFVDQGMKLGVQAVDWKIPWIAFGGESWLAVQKTEIVLAEQVSPEKLLILLSVIGLLATIAKSLAIYLGGISAAAFSNRAVRSLRTDLFRKFISLPLGFHHQKKAGELIARATADLTIMQGRLAKVVTGLIQHPLTAAAFMAYLLLMSYQLTLLVFIVSPVILGLIRLFGRKVKKHAVRMQNATAEVTSAYQEALVCLRVIQSFFRGQAEVGKFRELADYLYRKVMRWYQWDLGVSPMMDVAGFAVLAAVLILGRSYFEHTPGELASMIVAFAQLYMPIKKLAKVNNNLRTIQGATGRVFGIMHTVPEIQDGRQARPLPRHTKSIALQGVSFGYKPGEPILKDIDFEIKAGEMAAFVGSTGAGKSTLLDLIARFYDVNQGSITIDGTDIREVTLESLRMQIGVVSQDILLFHDTIANNIGYGRTKCAMEEVVMAAKQAHAHEFIMAQPQGYDTIVGDRGTLISGGQRQRIAIARALMIDPAILILDEAASALDAESEKLVQEAIDRLRGERTILVVGHRLSTVMKADRIYVLEAGRIVEYGTREELLGKENGRFRLLYDLQYGNGGD